MGLFSTSRKDLQIGVDFQSTGVAVVQIQNDETSNGEIHRSAFLPASGLALQQQSLRQWVEQHHLQKSPCVCLINANDCDINQIEKPAVEESELVQALTWRIKDLVSYDIATAVVDMYPMPVSSKNKTQQVSVVSAEESTVESYVDGIKSSRLNLTAIDIHDLVRKNLPSVKQAVSKSLALLSLGESSGNLSLFHDTDLYVSRAFKIGLNQLEMASSEDPSVYDSLLLEIQRSMDYYESYYGLGTVPSMEIFPRSTVTEKMALYLQNLTSFDIDFVNSNDQPAENNGLPNQCFHAYCAALRGV